MDINRIVNGYDTPAGEAPYYVRIVQCTNGGSCGYCGATWISETTILTAAHCISSTTTEMFYYMNPESNAYNGAGNTVSSWNVHECWDENESIFNNAWDIAVLTVPQVADVEIVRLETELERCKEETVKVKKENERVSKDIKEVYRVLLENTFGDVESLAGIQKL